MKDWKSNNTILKNFLAFQKTNWLANKFNADYKIMDKDLKEFCLLYFWEEKEGHFSYLCNFEYIHSKMKHVFSMKLMKSKAWQSYQYPFNSVRNSKSVKLKPLPESLSSHLNCWIRRRRPGRKGNGWPYTEGQVVPPSTTGWAMSSASSKKWGRLENS